MGGATTRTAAPWHLWPLGVLFVLLYAMGAYDYVQVQLHNTAYFASQGYGPRQVAYFADYPTAPLVFWTVNIAAGLAAGPLLLLRSRWAVVAAASAAGAQVVLHVITFGFMDRWGVLGPQLAMFDNAVLALTVAFWLYARRLHQRRALG